MICCGARGCWRRVPRGGCVEASWRLRGGFVVASWWLRGGFVEALWRLRGGFVAASWWLRGTYDGFVQIGIPAESTTEYSLRGCWGFIPPFGLGIPNYPSQIPLRRRYWGYRFYRQTFLPSRPPFPPLQIDIYFYNHFNLVVNLHCLC